MRGELEDPSPRTTLETTLETTFESPVEPAVETTFDYMLFGNAPATPAKQLSPHSNSSGFSTATQLSPSSNPPGLLSTGELRDLFRVVGPQPMLPGYDPAEAMTRPSPLTDPSSEALLPATSDKALLAYARNQGLQVHAVAFVADHAASAPLRLPGPGSPIGSRGTSPVSLASTSSSVQSLARTTPFLPLARGTTAARVSSSPGKKRSHQSQGGYAAELPFQVVPSRSPALGSTSAYRRPVSSDVPTVAKTRRRKIGTEVSTKGHQRSGIVPVTDGSGEGVASSALKLKMMLPWERKKMEKKDNKIFTKLQADIKDMAYRGDGDFEFALRSLKLETFHNQDSFCNYRGELGQVMQRFNKQEECKKFEYHATEGVESESLGDASQVKSALQVLHDEFIEAMTEETDWEPEPWMESKWRNPFKNIELDEDLVNDAKALRRRAEIPRISEKNMVMHLVEQAMKAKALKDQQDQKEAAERERIAASFRQAREEKLNPEAVEFRRREAEEEALQHASFERSRLAASEGAPRLDYRPGLS